MSTYAFSSRRLAWLAATVLATFGAFALAVYDAVWVTTVYHDTSSARHSPVVRGNAV